MKRCSTNLLRLDQHFQIVWRNWAAAESPSRSPLVSKRNLMISSSEQLRLEVEGFCVAEIHCVTQYLDFCASVLTIFKTSGPCVISSFFFPSLLTRTISFAPRLFKINHCSTCERGQLWSAAAAWMNSSSKVRPHIPTETKHGLTHVVQMRHLEHFGYSSLSGVISLHISLVGHRRHPRLKRLRLPLLAFPPRGDARGATAIQLCSTYSRQSDSGAG